MPDEFNPNQGLAAENAPSVVDLSDVATPVEGAGAWPKGWYRATIVEGYSTGKGTVMETRDALSKDAGSRNLHICFAVDGNVYVPSDSDPSKRKLSQGPGGTRNIRETYNYKPDDLKPERVATVKRAREAYKGKQGAWGEKGTEAHDMQSSSLSIGRIGQLQNAVGFKLPTILKPGPSGGHDRFDIRPFIKQNVDVRLGIDAKGFSEIAAVDKSGTHVK
jgi:hypothetical protein